MVTLQSVDEQKFQVTIKSAKMSETIKNLLEDATAGEPIPLPNITGKILALVVQYCNYHSEHPTVVSEEKKDEKRTDDIIPWDLDFCKVDQATLFELVLASNYLDIAELLNLTCKTIANMIKGKTPKEIKQAFGVKRDFTPEEEEEVRKDNNWLDER